MYTSRPELVELHAGSVHKCLPHILTTARNSRVSLARVVGKKPVCCLGCGTKYVKQFNWTPFS